MKKLVLVTVIMVMAFAMFGCAAPTPAPTQPPVPTQPPAAQITSSGYTLPQISCAPNCTYKDMVVGFIQTGPEGAWRTANNASFDEAAKQLGITLKVYDAQNKVENQISAFHTFNQDPTVNVILLAANDTKGFDDVLKEAQSKGKLVILEDRSLDSAATLYYTRIGSDFIDEGQKGAVAMCDLLKDFSKKNVVEISGAVGASAGIDRAKGFRQKMGDCGITITASQTGNWAVADSKAVVEAWLKDPTIKDFQGVFAHNDEEALGAIQAIQEAGLTPGKDIMVIGFDATKDGFAALIDGTMAADIECNPLLGPQVYDIALKGLNGDSTIPAFVPSQEGQFFAAQGAEALTALLPTRKY
jgi:ABC-type sugar transport system substrate-binding protein